MLEPCEYNGNGDFTAAVRRVVMSPSFEKIYHEQVFGSSVDASHPLGSLVPHKRMCYREVLILERNGDERVCRRGSRIVSAIHVAANLNPTSSPGCKEALETPH